MQRTLLSRHSLTTYAQGPPGRGGPGGGCFPDVMMQPQHRPGDALKEYGIDLTEMARNGKLDPTIGRDEEIRRTIQSNFSLSFPT
ncbi:hypothetical protein JAAARDRAFT_31469 [Jaapia argillacea MUCL 33604]|uniref:Uncharacterized protein n=1 Tax=Jaapia argillacea MUCL 33604 TaxID=933084 RepID=A0A067Q758_9AGAM|nr:hypothetical protein JAAARDRAFT_31469 [Jaapia argillacea MUCL 33604]